MNFHEAVKLYNQGYGLYNTGDYEAAARVLKQAAEKTESHKDDRFSPAKRKELQDIILEIWDWCAIAMHGARKYDEAVACNNRNLSVRLASPDYGPRHEDTLGGRRCLVENYTALRQRDNAIAECREILKVVDGSPDRNALANQLFSKGDDRSIKEAVNINLYTVKRDEVRVGKSDFSLCKARYNLGVELCKLRKFEDARDFLQENTTILEENPGSGSPKGHAKLLHDTKAMLASCLKKITTKEKLKKEKERKAREEAEKKQKESLVKERLKKEQIEKERLEKERLEKERLEKERLEKERLEKELLDTERLEKEHSKIERTEKERIEKERLEKVARERQHLIEKIKDAQNRRDQLVRSGNSLGLSPRRHSRVLTVDLEKNADLISLETLFSSLESELRDWNRLLKATESRKTSLGEPESRGRHKRASSNPSKPASEIGASTAKRPSVQSTAPILPSNPPSETNTIEKRKFITTSKIDVPRITNQDNNPPKTPRRTKSNDTLRPDASGLLKPGHALGRSSSVGRKNRLNSDGGNLFNADPNNPKTQADLWFHYIDDMANKFLDKYQGYVFEDRKDRKPYDRVKIAVLDTGAANSNKSGTPNTIRHSKNRIQWRKVEGNPLAPRDDDDGHGTQVSSIILKITPYAVLYSYRVVRTRKEAIQPKIVAAALLDAVKQGVDIVNMSFGWDHEIGEGHDELREAIRECHKNDVLIFAATSNDSLDSVSGMAYPARADGIIAIDAASSKGEWLPFNPSRDNEFKTHRFTALGQAIEADFPPQLGTKEPSKRMDGTSAATPVAVGIAALILEFARQPPLGYAHDVVRVLKRPDAMREVLAGAVARRETRHGEYRHLVPGKLFKCDSGSGDAGEWHHLTSPRRNAVDSIIAILKPKYGDMIAKPMNDRIERKWTEMALGR